MNPTSDSPDYVKPLRSLLKSKKRSNSLCSDSRAPNRVKNNGRCLSDVPVDQNLLDISESLTDNADSIRRILNEKPRKRSRSLSDLKKSKRLVGVKTQDSRDYEAFDVESNYSGILVDDETAHYPSSKRRYPNTRPFTPSSDRELTTRVADEPAYLNQFDELKFDSVGLPSAPNDVHSSNDAASIANLKQNISLTNRWTQYDQDGSMSYGIVPDDQLVHDNMVPFFSTRNRYGTNDLLNEHTMNFKNDLFTGNLKDTWKKKQEVSPFFTPVADLAHVYGTPIRAEGEEQRLFQSRYRQNEKLFDGTRVTPGLNLDYGQIGTHGNFSMYRALPKTVDELRPVPRQRVTFEARTIESGLRGKERPVQAPTITRKPDTFKITTEDDLLPTTDLNTGPKIRENFVLKETDRAEQTTAYHGSAYAVDESKGRNIPEWMREKYKCSTRQNFLLPKPLQKFAKDETVYNPNLTSYDNQPTLRSVISEKTVIGGASSVTGSATYTERTDPAKSTIKETTVVIPHQTVVTGVNQQQRAPNLTDLARSTIKETTVGIPHQTVTTAVDQQQRAPNYTDTARSTIKQTTVGIPHQTVTTAVNQFQRAPNYTDPARSTIKQTTVVTPHQTVVTSVNQQQRSPNYTDTARSTIKQTTVGLPHQTVTTAVNQFQRAPNYTDTARSTIKETTVTTPYQTVTTPINQQQRAPNYTDTARSTIKETTVNIPYQTVTTPINQQQRAPNYTDTARSTIKETTVTTPYQTITTPVDQQQRAPNYTDTARSTVKETTVTTPYQTVTTPINQQQRAPNYTDTARSTVKETTVSIPYQTVATPVNQQQRAPNYTDTARSTVKQTTVNIPYQTVTTPVNQQQRAPNYTDTARSTIKETTVNIPYQTVTTPINQQQRAPNYTDTARPTVKQTTVTIPHQTVITPVEQFQRTPNYTDTARSTIKQTTVDVPHQTFTTAVNQFQRAPNYTDTARSTVKQTTVGIPHQTFTTAVNQFQRAPNHTDTARSTVKQTTVDLPHQTFTTAVNQFQRAPNYTDTARSTVRQTTVDIPHQTVTTAVNQFQRAPNYTDTARSTVKETTVDLPHQTFTTAVNQSQRAPNYTDTARFTVKQTTVDIPHQTFTTAVNQFQRAPNYTDTARATLKQETIQIPYQTVITGIDQNQGSANTFDRTPLRNTHKQDTVQIPYQTTITAVESQQGSASSYDRKPQRTTIKETTINNEHIGGPSNDPNGQGYGYLSANMYAPNTNRQFISEETYLAPVKGDIREKIYDAAYCSPRDDRKELLLESRAPTNSSITIGPDKNSMNVCLRDDNNIAPDPFIGVSVNNQQDRMIPNCSVKTTDNIPLESYLDPTILSQLSANPFNIPYYGTPINKG